MVGRPLPLSPSGPGMRASARTSLNAAVLLVTIVAGCGGQRTAVRRDVVTSRWDTTMVVGGKSANDTTLLAPTWVSLWGPRIVVVDQPNEVVRVFDHRGRLLWSFGRRGHGPGEFENIGNAVQGPNGRLWILGWRNDRIVEVSDSGQMIREVSLAGYPVIPSTMLPLRNRVVFTTQTPRYGEIIADPDSLRIRSTKPFPWPQPLDYALNLTTVATSSSTAWVEAFEYGPGFMVGRADTVRTYHYFKWIPWAQKAGPALNAAHADSARYAARAASIAGNEVYFLFGGRPKRYAHPHEPTRYIDVYGLDGRYHRSFRLPSDTWSMATVDGRTFYVLTLQGDLPILLGLRARLSETR